jgi:phosphatidylserine/phosphatidylglycerophosphate/cardiolipin synthase-like enzyme
MSPGSFNFSAKAVEKNDEDIFVIRSKVIAAAYAGEFAHVDSIGKPLPKRPVVTAGILGSIPGTNPD